MAKYYTDRHKRLNQQTPLIALRLPSQEVREELRNVALAESTSVSGWVRELILDALQERQKEPAKQTL